MLRYNRSQRRNASGFEIFKTDVDKAPDRGSLLQGTTAIRADVTALTKGLSQEPETLMQLVRYGAVWAATSPV